jgi:predicted permease
LLTEGVVLALGGVAAGVPIAYALVGFVKMNTALAVPLLERIDIDGGVILFAGGSAVMTGLASMTLPALKIAKREPDRLIRQQPGSVPVSPVEETTNSVLVIAEVALTCVLLVCAGLLARSFLNLISLDLGFRPSQAHRVRLNLGDLQSIEQTPRRIAVLDEVVTRVSAVPGVEAGGITDALPLERNRGWAAGDPNQVYPPGRRPSAFLYVIGPGYLSAMGIPLIAGRDFSAEDTSERPAVIVNERLARRLWPGQDPLGRPFATSWPGRYTVVGVVADVRQSRLEEPSSVFQMYLPYTQVPVAAVDLIIRSSLPASTLAPAIRTTLTSIDQVLMASPLRPLDELVERAVSPRLFLMRLIAGFSLLALLLACAGIYSVVSYGVSQRIHEIGVRVALGANSRDLCRSVMAGVLRATTIGIAIGTVAAGGVARLITGFLYGTSPADPGVFAGVPVTVTIVALLAAYLPARRAALIDPMRALRSE